MQIIHGLKKKIYNQNMKVQWILECQLLIGNGLMSFMICIEF